MFAPLSMIMLPPKSSSGSAEPSGSCSRKRPLTQLSDSTHVQCRRSSRNRRAFSRLAGIQENVASFHQSEVTTEIEDVAPDNVQAITGEVLPPPPPPPHITGSQGKGVSINPDLEPTFLAILKKHGDITSDCCLESGGMLTSVLEVICKLVQELHNKDLDEVDCRLLNFYYLVVKDAENMKVNVNWLRTHLDEIKEAAESIVVTKELNDEMNEIMELIENEKKDLEAMEVEFEKLKFQIAAKKSTLDLHTLMAEDVNSMIKARALKYQKRPLI